MKIIEVPIICDCCGATNSCQVYNVILAGHIFGHEYINVGSANFIFKIKNMLNTYFLKYVLYYELSSKKCVFIANSISQAI